MFIFIELLYSGLSMFDLWLYFQVNSVDLDPTNTLVVTGTMDGKCQAVLLVIIAIAFMTFCVRSALNSILQTFSILLSSSVTPLFGFSLSLSYTDALFGFVTQSSWLYDEPKRRQPLSVRLSLSLSSAFLGHWKNDPSCGWSRNHPESGC